jgi:hypothetical protein
LQPPGVSRRGFRFEARLAGKAAIVRADNSSRGGRCCR